MGATSSVKSSNTVLSAESLPKELFVEGSGSARANGKFVLRTDKNDFPTKVVPMCNQSAWFAKEDDVGCWMGFVDTESKNGREKSTDERKWIIFTATEVLYIASTTDGKISSPREGLWELGEKGPAPPPTVNQQPLPTPFRLIGWKVPHDRLNGEYLPLDDGAKLNNRPIFKHAPVLDGWARRDKYWMYWSGGAWRIGDKEHLQPDTVQCLALAESEASHPTEIGGAVWKAAENGVSCSEHDGTFKLVEGLTVATGTSVQIYITSSDGAVTSLTVRPWFDSVKDLRAQVFHTDAPPQRQQLFFQGNQLHTDGLVLAQHGVIAECTINLVTLEKKAFLDAVFDEAGTVRAMEVVGGPSPAACLCCYDGGYYNPLDGRIYLPPRNSARAASFDPATKTWESFGDTFPVTTMCQDEKWSRHAFSSSDKCLYAFPVTGKKIRRMLKVDPVNRTAQEIGEDMRPFIDTDTINVAAIWDAVAGADGYIYAIPGQINHVLRFDPRTNKVKKFGKIQDMMKQRLSSGSYPPKFGTDLNGRELKYMIGVLDASGRYIYCPPSMASRVLCIDTQKLTVELIGDDFGICEGDSWFDAPKFHTATLADDNCIYAFAWTSQITRVMRIDPMNKTASFFGPNLDHAGLGQYYGACAGSDGCVYATPHYAKYVLQVDPFAGTVSKVGEAHPPELSMKLGTSVLDRDGAIWHLPLHGPAPMVRQAPRQPQTPFLARLAQPQHHNVLREGLRDLRCYGPTLAVALWREAVRIGGDSALVSGLLESAATALPDVVMASIKKDSGSTAYRLLQTILAVMPPQETDYYFNPTLNTWEWHEAEAKKRGMHLASVASEQEQAILHQITNGVKTWIGGCRKSTSRQPPDTRDSAHEFGGPDDWEWSDGTPFSYTIWHGLEPNNQSNNISGGEDRVNMENNFWCDSFSGEMIAGIYRKPRFSPPIEAIRAIVTGRHVLARCFACSDELRGALVRIIYHTMAIDEHTPAVNKPPLNVAGPQSHVDATVTTPAAKPPTNKSTNVPKSRFENNMSTIAEHLETDWANFSAALLAVRRAPPSLSANDQHRFAFLSHFVNASAILEAPAPNAWEPLPKSPVDWSWPPPPLVPLRAAAKIVQMLGSDVVRAVWPVLADRITAVLVRMIDAVLDDLVNATDLLKTIFNRERKASLGTYQKQLRRSRRDPTFPEFTTAAANLMEQLKEYDRKQLRIQTTHSFFELYATAEAMHKRFNEFLVALSHKCATATALFAPLKGMGRALEKLVLTPGVAAQFKAVGLEGVDSRNLTDVLRGSLKCPDFTEIVFILDLLEMLDVDMGDSKKAKQQGWDLEKYQIRIIHLKDRFNKPTSGGWADAMVNFCFVHGDDTQHVMELQLQHAQMLVVRKEGKAHDQYNSFRSAFELLESVGRAPLDCFNETDEDLPPLEKLRREMQQQMQEMQQQMQQQMQQMQQKQIRSEEQMQHKIHELEEKIQMLQTEDDVLRVSSNS